MTIAEFMASSIGAALFLWALSHVIIGGMPL